MCVFVRQGERAAARRQRRAAKTCGGSVRLHASPGRGLEGTCLSGLSRPAAADRRPSASSAQDWDEATITVMDSRLNTLLALLHPGEGDASIDTVTESASARTTGPDERASSSLPPGWRKLSERDGWRPAPIGVYVRCA